MESVLNTVKGICYLCHEHKDTELHHIYHSHHSKKFKKLQERMGLVVYLCIDCHKGSEGVHGSFGVKKDQDLKREAQNLWEMKYIENYPYEHHAEQAAREEWMKQIQRNYLC